MRAVLALLALAGCASWPGGIGAVLRYRPSTRALYVERAPDEGAAARSGLRAGDRIVSIDGGAVEGLGEADVRARLRGEVGTHVRLRIERGGAEQDVDVERAPYR